MAKTEQNPDEVIQLQVKQGKTALIGDKAIGDRGTLQLRRADAAELLKAGTVEEVEGHEVPDVSERPNVPPPGSRKA